MKYVVVLYDGMADYPVPALGGKTPMMCAKKPLFDSLARRSVVGLVKTVDDSLKPGSDVANMSVMGFDPLKYYTGRSPLEAVSIGVNLRDDDITLRCNLVTLSEDEPYESKTMVDYSAGDISTEEAREIMKSVQEHFGNEEFTFYPGVSYRHCLVVENGTTELGTMTPPHDISGRVVGEYLSDTDSAKPLIDLMKKSYNILKDHPVNKARAARGKRPANSIWLWGEGRRPELQNFKEKNGVSGGVVSAVDLLKGIGICAGMATPEVAGATGYIDTNFEGKTEAAIKLFRDGFDLAYVHLEAPDECGHRGEAENKVKAIELIDSKVIAPLCEYLRGTGEDFRVLIMPDHPTPLNIKTHSSEPVPFLIYDSSKNMGGVDCFTEAAATATGLFIDHGPSIMDRLLKK